MCEKHEGTFCWRTTCSLHTDSFIRVPWLVQISNLRHDSFICVKHRSAPFAGIQRKSSLHNDSFVRAPWLFQVCDMPQLHVWNTQTHLLLAYNARVHCTMTHPYVWNTQAHLLLAYNVRVDCTSRQTVARQLKSVAACKHAPTIDWHTHEWFLTRVRIHHFTHLRGWNARLQLIYVYTCLGDACTHMNESWHA